MLKFNTMMQEAGFDPERVFLLRHEDKRVREKRRTSLYQIWKEKRKDFEAYQSTQKWKNRLQEGSSLAAFVVGSERETLFVGMYDVLKLWRENGPCYDPVLGDMGNQDRSCHELKHSDRMQEYEEKLVIDWGPGKLAWRQRANEKNGNKHVLEIRAQAKQAPFPGYIKFRCQLGELVSIYPSWQQRFEEGKGVYLLTFDDGMQYVGSAKGEDGFWQRWQNYLANGHGGNQVLIRDHRDARSAMISILEVSGSADTDQDIIGQEMTWQQKLGTRAKRLDPTIPGQSSALSEV
jgi:hypothetical protein